MWLADERIAEAVVNALAYGAEERNFYDLFAYVVMSNHVHIVIRPHVELSVVMRWLKGRTARVANRILGRAGKPFWNEESYDHIIRSHAELLNTINYIEQNPVRAGYVVAAELYRWSNAHDGPKKVMACLTGADGY
jgi:putative transposase